MPGLYHILTLLCEVELFEITFNKHDGQNQIQPLIFPEVDIVIKPSSSSLNFRSSLVATGVA